MTVIDITICAVIGISTLFGTLRGFFASAFSLMGWIASIILTIITYPFFVKYLENTISNELILNISSYSILFIGYMIFFAILGALLNNLLTPINNNIFNRILGLLFGVIRGAALVILPILALHFLQNANHGVPLDKADISPAYFVTKGPFGQKAVDTAQYFIDHTQDGFWENQLKTFDNVVGTTSEERFIEYISAKLKRNIKKQKYKLHEEEEDEEEKIENKASIRKLRGLFIQYKKMDKNLQLNPLTEYEINRLEHLLKS